MIKIESLTVKNFMSVGNVSQAVDFENEQLTLVLGENLDQGGDDNGSRNGTGKSQPLNSKILTPDGWKLMGDIRVGDYVISIDGAPTKVTGVFPQGKLQTYKITFDDGRQTRASGDHLWSVYSNQWFKKSDANNKTKILTTEEISNKIKKYTLPNGKKNPCAYLYAPLPSAICFSPTNLKINPWLLGFLLGDGCLSKKTGIGFSSNDQYLIEKASSILKEELGLSVEKNPGKYDYGIKGLGKGTSHPLRKVLNHYQLNGTLSHTKFIPEDYKNSSINDRIQILQGLIDSDGTVDRRTGTPTFTTTSLQLANDFVYIIRSLGGIAKITKKIHKNQNHKDSFAVTIRSNFSRDLFSLERKKQLVKENYQYKNKLRAKFASIELDTVEECQCIMIDHPSKLYITDDFVVTHNTTIVNALSYAFYGQALTNIKKDNLINKINSKGMIVTVNFSIGSTKYRIERGRKPNILKFYINGKEQDTDDVDESQGDSRKTQESISALLGMTHTMFKHVVALNTYTEPFLSLRANDQREVIEQLLGITLLSEKAEALKAQIKDIKDSIVQETAKIEAIKSSNDKINNTINSLKLKQTAWNNQKQKDIDKIAKAIDNLEAVDINQELLDHEALKIWLSNNDKLKAYTKEKSSIESTLTQAHKASKKAQSDFEKLQSHACHACGQKLHDKKHAEMLSELSKHLQDCQKYESDVNDKLNSVIQNIEFLGDIGRRPNTFYDDYEEAYNHKSNLDTLKTQLESKVNEEDPFQDQIIELSNTAIQKIDWTSINDLNSVKDHQEFLLKLLTNKDSFIRKKIIDQNLSFLNQRLTYYLEQSGLPHQVVFQNDLQVEITQLGQDLDFDNLSRGERNRLILSMSWAFRDMWENLYQPINLLFIDELIDNGLDSSGVENALSILKAMARERSKNIYLISHKDELVGRVNNVLKVIKENGFTSYSNDIEVSGE